MKKAIATVVIAAGITALAACGSSGPPTATGTLKSDGYSVLKVEDRATINRTFGSAAPDISQVAVGVNGKQAEVVIVSTDQGAGLVRAGVATVSLPADVHYSSSGDVFRFRGTLQALSSLSSA